LSQAEKCLPIYENTKLKGQKSEAKLEREREKEREREGEGDRQRGKRSI